MEAVHWLMQDAQPLLEVNWISEPEPMAYGFQIELDDQGEGQISITDQIPSCQLHYTLF